MSATSEPQSSSRRVRSRLGLGLLAVVLLGGVSVAAWKGWLEDRLVVKRWGVVEPGRIYRSGQISEHLVRSTLAAHRVGMIVQLSGDDPADRDQAAEHAAARDLGIDVRRCPLKGDGTGDPASYVAALSAIHDAEAAGKPVLIHCHAGSQRTGGVVACYRVLFQGRSAEEAVAEMERFAWRRGRDEILLTYLNENLPQIVEDLQRRGLVDSPERMPVFR